MSMNMFCMAALTAFIAVVVTGMGLVTWYDGRVKSPHLIAVIVTVWGCAIYFAYRLLISIQAHSGV